MVYGKEGILAANGKVELILYRDIKNYYIHMKRKGITFEKEQVNLNQNEVIIAKDGDEYFFEIGAETTTDVAEAVSILMRTLNWNDSIWKTEVTEEMKNVTPEKALYWLSGGKNEWNTLNHYKNPWCEYYLDFQEEFGFLIVNIVNRAKTLLDIREEFNRYLNLETLYNYALSKNMIR